MPQYRLFPRCQRGAGINALPLTHQVLQANCSCTGSHIEKVTGLLVKLQSSGPTIDTHGIKHA
jgi:hypothetical protein